MRLSRTQLRLGSHQGCRPRRGRAGHSSMLIACSGQASTASFTASRTSPARVKIRGRRERVDAGGRRPYCSYPNEDGGAVTDSHAAASGTQPVQAAIDALREQGIDVVRVSYSDMIGVDRGRDVLIDELPAALGHGLPFCRAIFHTSPQGDVVPVAGGLDAGLPDVLVRPDLATLTPLPWEPAAAW